MVQPKKCIYATRRESACHATLRKAGTGVIAYLAPKPQLLLLLPLSILLLCMLYPRKFALMEACEVLFARGKVKLDLFGDCHGDFAFLRWRRHVPHGCSLCQVWCRVRG
jgi:hypothetical protein